MPKKKFYENQANTIISNMNKRGFEGYYVNSKEEALNKVISFIKEGDTIGWGGSMSMEEIGVFDELKKGNYTLYDRFSTKDEEERLKIYAKTVVADHYLMSTNAITLDGELVNIDGTGNRIACLEYGPREVIIVAGMNKVVTSVEDGYNRVKNQAAPPNGVRLNRKTPCAMNGKCGDCYGGESMCSHTVISRRSAVPGRIKIILVGEELGY